MPTTRVYYLLDLPPEKGLSTGVSNVHCGMDIDDNALALRGLMGLIN